MPTPPIVINFEGDIQLYRTLIEAEVSLEPWEVTEKAFTAFDSRGLVLDPEGHEGNPVRLHDSSPPEFRPAELEVLLRDLLRGLVRDVGEDRIRVKIGDVERLSLPELIEKLIAFQRPEKRRSFWFWKD